MLSMHTLLNCVPALQHTLDCHARLAGRCVAVSQSQILMSHWLIADHMTSNRNTFVPSLCTHAINRAIAISRICKMLIASDLWWTLIPVYQFWCVLCVFSVFVCIRSSLCCILTFVQCLGSYWRLLSAATRKHWWRDGYCGYCWHKWTVQVSWPKWCLRPRNWAVFGMHLLMLFYGSHLYFVSSSSPSL